VSVWPYLFREYVQAGMRERARSYVLVAHAGYGINSYAIHYYLVRGPLRVFVQIVWGGVYSNGPKHAAAVNRCFALLEHLILTVEAVVAAGHLQRSDRLVVAASSFYGSHWIRPDGETMEEATPESTLTAVLTWLRESLPPTSVLQ
jgi:hypothetical protein